MTERIIIVDNMHNRGLAAAIEKGLERKLFSEEEVHRVFDETGEGLEAIVYADWRVRLARMELSARQKANVHDRLFHARGKPDTHNSGKRIGMPKEIVAIRRKRVTRTRW